MLITKIFFTDQIFLSISWYVLNNECFGLAQTKKVVQFDVVLFRHFDYNQRSSNQDKMINIHVKLEKFFGTGFLKDSCTCVLLCIRLQIFQLVYPKVMNDDNILLITFGMWYKLMGQKN